MVTVKGTRFLKQPPTKHAWGLKWNSVFSTSWMSLVPFSLPHWNLGNLCCEQLGRGSPLAITLLAWSNILPTVLPMFSQAVSVTASVGVWPCCTARAPWGAGRAMLELLSRWGSDQSSAIPIKSFLLPHLTYLSAKGGIKFHFCVLHGKGENVFQRTKKPEIPSDLGKQNLDVGGLCPRVRYGPHSLFQPPKLEV